MVWILVGLNLILIISYLIFLYRKYARKSETRLFVFAILLKCSFGIMLGFIYNHNYEGGDAFQYYKEARKMASYHKYERAAMHDVLFNTQEEEEKLWDKLKFKNEPRSMLFVKITFVIFLLTGGKFWLITIYFATISFTGLWMLYRTISNINPQLSTGLMVGFFFWPSSVFWSSGILKESVAIFLICTITALVLNYLFFQKGTFIDFLIVLVFVFVLWKLRYFYAAVLCPVLIGYSSAYFLADTFNKMRSPRNTFLAYSVAMICFFIIATYLHPNLGLQRVFDVMADNYTMYVSKSAPGTYIEFSNLNDKTGILLSLPKALLSGAFRPNLWDINDNLWSILACVENFVFTCLFIFWLIRSIQNRRIFSLPVYSILIYAFISTTFLAFAAPNFGSLVRYKAGILPFLIALVYSDPRLTAMTIKIFKFLKLQPEYPH